MREFKTVLCLCILSCCVGFSGGVYFYHPQSISKGYEPQVKVFFSPKGGCTEAITTIIGGAQKSILIQAYSFTSEPIVQALIRAKERGVEVRVVLDRSQYEARSTAAVPLHSAGIEVRMDAKHSIAHSKVMIIDEQILITGSFNFTRQAEISNAENVLIMLNPDLAAAYVQNWNLHYEHSDPYNGETTRPRK